MNHNHIATAALALALLSTTATANNIQVTNPSLTGNTGTTVMVQFDISWQNSWRGGGVSNWDAAWVFVKYRSNATAAWQHLRLSNAGHVAPGGSQIDPGLLSPSVAYNATSNPVVGAFLYRNAAGNGTFTLTGVQLQVDLAAAGVAYNDLAEIQVFAIEMVYVPQGAFAAGSGGTENAAFILTTISTGNATTAPSGSGSLGGQAGGYPTGQTAPNNAWPNGYNAFYCMKYEVTQQGYVDFLNTLTYAQQVTRTTTAPNSPTGTGALTSTNANRNGIDVRTPGVDPGTPASYGCNLNGNGIFLEANDGSDIACNWISWGDLTAYLDWSGLRPMTELEFEKACRGTIAPVANEYPWGSNGVAASAYTLANAGATNEGITTNYSSTLGNASYDNTDGAIDGPLRVGVFAANGSNSGRVTAGASYYGIMELGGNLYERPVTIGNVEGRAYTGAHGNGGLAADGNGDATIWPAPTTAQGAGFRGGGWLVPASLARLSDRNDAASLGSSRQSYVGGRGVRLSP